MAKIKWLHHPTKPELNGTTEHVARELATIACGYGQAELCPRPGYGSPEWLADRAALSAAAHANPTDVNPTVAGVEWGVQDKSLSVFSKVLVLKRSGSTIEYFDAPPADAPLTVIQRFRDLTLTDRDEAGAAAITVAKKQAEANKETERVGVCQKIFASRA